MEAVINVHDIRHSFGEGALRKEVLHGITTEFHSGEIVIITGPSGSGKTTFLTLVGALRSVQEGSVRVLNEELRELDTRRLTGIRRHIGFIFQAHNLIESLTACRNVQMAFVDSGDAAPEDTRRLALEALDEVGLAEHAHKYPRQLSGGQKQRVAIARALVRKPRIILADEPTAALDSKTGREVVELLQRLARNMGCTILIVTHDNRILDVADRIIRIEDGYMEETHLGMERLLRDIEQMLRLLPPVIAPFAAGQIDAPGSQTAVRPASFAPLASALRQGLAALSNGRFPVSLRTRLDALQEIAEASLSLEDALASLLGHMMDPSIRQLAGISDMIVQSCEFLVLTTIDTIASRTREDTAMLLALTGDRGGVMEKLRNSVFASQSEPDPAARNSLFDMTNIYARLVYFINRIAQYLDRYSSNSTI
jgi:putative ABC transport system ATP-binding protein